MNRPGDVLDVHIAKDLSVERDLALNLGESQVVAVAVRRQVALDLVSGKVALVAGEVYLHRPRSAHSGRRRHAQR